VDYIQRSVMDMLDSVCAVHWGLAMGSESNREDKTSTIVYHDIRDDCYGKCSQLFLTGFGPVYESNNISVGIYFSFNDHFVSVDSSSASQRKRKYLEASGYSFG
jgi:hypothetical protein